MTGWPAAIAEAALHGPAGEFVLRTEPHSEAHPAALLAQFLVAFGTACGRGAHYQVEADRHYPNEFCVLVGPSAKGRKGSSWGHVRRVLAETDPGFADGCLASGLSSGEGLIAQVRDPLDDTDSDAPTDKRRLVLEQEFAQVLKVLSREGNTLSPIVRQAWDGETLADTGAQQPAARHRSARRDRRAHHQGRAVALPDRDRTRQWLLQPVLGSGRRPLEAAAVRQRARRRTARRDPRRRPPRAALRRPPSRATRSMTAARERWIDVYPELSASQPASPAPPRHAPKRTSFASR